jgi:hypothetical protein
MAVEFVLREFCVHFFIPGASFMYTWPNLLIKMVRVKGFEPPAPAPETSASNLVARCDSAHGVVVRMGAGKCAQFVKQRVTAGEVVLFLSMDRHVV